LRGKKPDDRTLPRRGALEEEKSVARKSVRAKRALQYGTAIALHNECGEQNAGSL